MGMTNHPEESIYGTSLNPSRMEIKKQGDFFPLKMDTSITP